MLTATVFPCPSDLKTDLFEKPSNALVCELVTIFGVNGFAWHEVKIKILVLDTYILLLRALEVHLDPVERQLPGHILLDLNFPGMSGLEVLSEIREDKSFRPVPVVNSIFVWLFLVLGAS